MALSGIFPVMLGTARYEETSTDAKFETGTCSMDNQGGMWIYAKASETIAAYVLSKISTAAVRLAEPVKTTDIASLVPMLGIPQVNFAIDEFGWFWRGPGGGVGKGIKVLAAASCVKDVLLFTTATDGVVDDAVVTDSAVAGLTICATVTSAAAAECYSSVMLACNQDEGVA